MTDEDYQCALRTVEYHRSLATGWEDVARKWEAASGKWQQTAELWERAQQRANRALVLSLTALCLVSGFLAFVCWRDLLK